VKGADYPHERIVGAEFVEPAAAVSCAFPSSWPSTTQLLERACLVLTVQ
jgi:bifunctional ADP-heptose synthase (sugar kinase/adenylyltransferase)